MAGTAPDPYGDYEYDLVHEQGVAFEVPHEQHHESSPPPSPDPGGDYGYDEAHDCRAVDDGARHPKTSREPS